MALEQRPSQPSANARQAAPSPVPKLIRRNTLLLAASQTFVGTGNQMIPTLGALIVERLLGNASLAGIGTSILGVSRFLVAYPMGRITDTYGRKAGLVAGLLISMVGAAVTGLAVIAGSFPIFVLGMLVFGSGVAGAQQLRVAAADMYPPRLRGRGLGIVLTGSLVGALGGPLLIQAAQGVSKASGVDATALAWILVPVFIVPALFLVLQVRPDPKVIAVNLEQYYPDYKAPPSSAAGSAGAKTGFFTFIRHYPKLAAFLSFFAVHGTMTMMMAMTALALKHHGHGLSVISIAVTIHVVGMFGFSLPLGRMVDRVGRRPVMLAGMVICGAGATLVPMTPSYWTITLGIFLVGVGWSCVNVAASALIVDTTGPQERGRAIGTNDTFSAAAGIIFPLAGGPVAEYAGLPSLAFLSLALLVVPFLLVLRLREPSPGKYAEQAAAAKTA